MLSYLPNLTSLRLGPNFTKQSILLGIVLRAALCEPNNPSLPRFERLPDVFFDCGVDSLKHMVNTIDVLLLFYLPAVSNISVGIDNPDTVFEWPGGTPPGTSEISALSLAGIRELHLGHYSRLPSHSTRFDGSGTTTPISTIRPTRPSSNLIR